MDSRIQEILVNINTASQFMPDIAIVIWSILISLEELGGLGEPGNRVLLAHSSSTGAHLHHAHLMPFIHPEVDLRNLTKLETRETSRPSISPTNNPQLQRPHIHPVLRKGSTDTRKPIEKSRPPG